MTPMWRTANETIAEPLPDEPGVKLETAHRKQLAQKFLDTWRPVLWPADDGE